MPKRQTCKEFYRGCGLLLRITGNKKLIYDCNEYFDENPEPICPAHAQSIVPQTVEATTAKPVVPIIVEEATDVSTIDSENGQYLK